MDGCPTLCRSDQFCRTTSIFTINSQHHEPEKPGPLLINCDLRPISDAASGYCSNTRAIREPSRVSSPLTVLRKRPVQAALRVDLMTNRAGKNQSTIPRAGSAEGPLAIPHNHHNCHSSTPVPHRGHPPAGRWLTLDKFLVTEICRPSKNAA